MSERLKSALKFPDLAPGATFVLNHQLQMAVGHPLAPDIIFIPSPNIAVVSSNDVAVTIRNDGPTLSGVILVEYWHPIERKFGGPHLAVKPYVVVSAEPRNQPASPPFQDPVVVNTIFVRPTGSDTTGDGTSIATAFRKWQHAIRMVPLYIPAGFRWIIDVSGIGVETFVRGYAMPAIKAAASLDMSVPESADPQYRRRAAITTRADLQLFSKIPAADCTINPGDILSFDPHPKARIYTLTLNGVGRASWAGNALKGAIFTAKNPSGGGDAVVAESTATTLLLTLSDKNNNVKPTAPYVIKEQSATFMGETADDGSGGSAFNIFNVDSFAFNGIKFVNSAVDPDEGCLGIRAANSIYSLSYCDFSSFTVLQGGAQYRQLIENSYFHGGFALVTSGATLTINASLLDGIKDWITIPGSGYISLNDSVCNEFTRPFGETRPLQTGNFNRPTVHAGGGADVYTKFCIVQNGLSQGMAPKGGGSIEFTLVRGSASDAFRADKTTGPLQLTNVELQGTGAGGIALNLLNGASVNVDPKSIVNGAVSDYKVGANAGSAGGGAGFAALVAETDLAAGNLSQLCRLTKS